MPAHGSFCWRAISEQFHLLTGQPANYTACSLQLPVHPVDACYSGQLDTHACSIVKRNLPSSRLPSPSVSTAFPRPIGHMISVPSGCVVNVIILVDRPPTMGCRSRSVRADAIRDPSLLLPALLVAQGHWGPTLFPVCRSLLPLLTCPFLFIKSPLSLPASGRRRQLSSVPDFLLPCSLAAGRAR